MIGRLITGGARLFTGASPRWLGDRPVLEPRVYFANHTSHFDFVVLWSCLPHPLRERTRPVAGRDYWERGPVRRHLAARVFRAVLIDREHVTRECNPVEPLVAALDAGNSLILFPEGTRCPGPAVRDFKSGLFHLLRARPATPAVPVFIENLNRVLPKGEVLPVPLLCSVTFGAPLQLVDGEGKTPFLARARAALEALGKS